MLIFKLFSLNNIFYYFSIFVIFILLFFLSYKYLYLEQSLFVLSNRLNRYEIEYNNPSIYTPPTSSTSINSAEIIMNEIFKECDDETCTSESCNYTNKTNTPPSPKVVINDEVQIINEIFDLKKDTDDKESIISANINSGGGGHATKKALMKLSLDKLKAQCEERKLSSEGTKNQLADRIIVHDNSVEITDINDLVD